MRVYAAQLEKRGIHVTSRWLQENEPLQAQMGDHDADFYSRTARVDLDDIDAADSILFFAEDPLVGTPRGGRHVEFGYAIARNKFIDVVGPAENIFHYGNPMIKHWPDFETYLQANITEVTFG